MKVFPSILALSVLFVVTQPNSFPLVLFSSVWLASLYLLASSSLSYPYSSDSSISSVSAGSTTPPVGSIFSSNSVGITTAVVANY